jgi:hypothetical protein
MGELVELRIVRTALRPCDLARKVLASELELSFGQIGFLARMRQAETCSPRQWQWLMSLAQRVEARQVGGVARSQSKEPIGPAASRGKCRSGP